MKDYRLSEIKKACLQQPESCDDCKCESFCHCTIGKGLVPGQWDNIDPRDMIELPCKISIANDKWQVIHRDKDNAITIRTFREEAEADKFLYELREKNIKKLIRATS